MKPFLIITSVIIALDLILNVIYVLCCFIRSIVRDLKK